jgi:hypothetical protein
MENNGSKSLFLPMRGDKHKCMPGGFAPDSDSSSSPPYVVPSESTLIGQRIRHPAHLAGMD